MNAQTAAQSILSPDVLTKADPNLPALRATGPDTIAIRAGTTYGAFNFADDVSVIAPEAGYEPGADYLVAVANDTKPRAFKVVGQNVNAAVYIGGFHFAPGGNATARAGGDDIPQINPRSLWDRNFRPNCLDPRGMTLVEKPAGKFWCDIYLTGVNHLTDGTSKFGVQIADGRDLPRKPNGGSYERFDYATATAVLELHGKGLLSTEDFYAAAFGVTERTSADVDPKITRLDAPRTSKWGVIQATGNMDIWGHDGDPDQPTAALFGGNWGELAADCGSRASYWFSAPWFSYGFVGARGRCDHLQLG